MLVENLMQCLLNYQQESSMKLFHQLVNQFVLLFGSLVLLGLTEKLGLHDFVKKITLPLWETFAKAKLQTHPYKKPKKQSAVND